MAHKLAQSDMVTAENKDANSSPANSDDVEHKNELTKFQRLVSQEIPDANSKLLKNAIHPIFQKQNWEKQAQRAWPLLEPALRLASRFIGEEEMLAFWYHLVWGRQKMQDVSEEFGHDLERFSAEGPPLTTLQKQQTSNWLQGFRGKQQSPFLKFQAGLLSGDRTDSSRIAWGKTYYFADGGVIMALNSELLELLRVHKNFSETQPLRVNFWIAVVLLHELGHAVRGSLGSSEYEPYYGDQVVAEVGHAWGCCAFGGMIQLSRMPTNEKNRTFIAGFRITTPPSPWKQNPLCKKWPASLPPPPILGELPKRATFWFMTTEYIQRVQTDEFWEGDIKTRGVRALHVPPTDGIQDRLLLTSNWMANVNIRRGSNDEQEVESGHLRTPAEWEKYS